jgi:protein subunit release factor B
MKYRNQYYYYQSKNGSLQLRGWLAEGIHVVKFGFVHVVRILPANLHGRRHCSVLDSERIKS